MLTQEDRLEYCKKCIHKVEHKRYGVLCGLTNNYPHFKDKCEHFQKEKSTSFDFDTSLKGEVTPPKDLKKVFKRSKKEGRSWISIAFILYIVFKIIVRLLRENGISF